MKILITGGVGFIGTNTALYFANLPENQIDLVDNFSRHGVDSNAAFIQEQAPQVGIHRHDIAQTDAYLDLIKQADVIIHLAGQTAVTTSIADPQLDFDSNLRGSFQLLEAVRQHNPEAILLYSSTNKVYGDLRHHRIELDAKAQQYRNLDHPDGVDESERLAFISPYGCSKGAMDAYMEDYARIYGLRTVVFRQSCIYGRFQMGVEDQGWVAHFSKQFLSGAPITIFGDGFQVRDLLFVDDLIDAYHKAIEHIDTVQGKALNIGGGPENAYSLKQVIQLLQERIGDTSSITYDQTRAGDQPYFVSSNAAAKELIDWQPSTSFTTGIDQMIDWQRRFFRVS